MSRLIGLTISPSKKAVGPDIVFFMAISLICSVFIVLSTIAVPRYLEASMQKLGEGEALDSSLLGMFAFAYFIRALFKLLRNHITTYMGNLLTNRLREAGAAAVVKGHGSSGNVADIYSRLTYDLTAVTELLSWRTFVFLENLAILVSAIVIIAGHSLFVALWMAALFLAIFVCSALFGAHLQGHIRKVKASVADLNGFIRETLQNQRILRAYGAEGWQRSRFEKKNEDNKKSQREMRRCNAFWIPVMETISQITVILSLGMAAWLVLYGKNEMGFLALLNGYLSILITVTVDLGGLVHFFISSRDSVRNLRKMTAGEERLSGKDKDKGAEELPKELKQLFFQAGELKAGGKRLFQDVELSFEPGTMTVISGFTGCGKTALADALAMTGMEQGAAIFWNGVLIGEDRQKEYWKRVGYSMQVPCFFQGTLKENIVLNRNVAEKELRRLSAVCHLDFVEDLEKGFSTVLNSESNFLSGGEKQRICLARALAGNPDILILDDALQAIDRRTREKILAYLGEWKTGHIVVCFSSDFMEQDAADRVLFIQDGKLIPKENAEAARKVKESSSGG